MAAENGSSRLQLRSNLCWQLTAEHRSENASWGNPIPVHR